ncbi:MAG: DUF4214 domain-containing protein, partial [Gammaproteobacteria bacterium]|nr:DUF4214 domain-containing protein [Gammaproteobacteria bacterium]
MAIFNRASEGEGNRYWQGREGSTADVANAMLATEPAQTYFGSATADNRLFIEHIYFNTLGRSAEEDPEGIAYWVGRLEQSSQGDVIVAIIDALLRHAPDASDMHKENQQNFLNRVKVSNYTSDISDAFPAGFDYEENLGFTTNLLVNADPATVEAAKAKVFALINPDSIFTLQSLPGQTDVDLSIDADPQLSESLLAFLQDVANLDLVAEGLLDEQGNPTGSIGHVSIVDNPADGTTSISLTSDDGINGSWQIDGSLAHLASILFGDALDSPATGIVLTTNSNNGGTIEPGFTGVGADHIIVGRPELLHGAYIDGGPGYNTLSIDMSGVFAQPLQLLNIQQVNVTNLPNNYRLDPQLFGDLLTFPGSNLSSELWTTGSTLDLSRATSLEKLLITESGLSYNDHGPLAVTGIKGSTTARLEGDFHQSVGLYYGSGQGNGIDLELANVTMAEGSLALGHNAGVVRLLSEGAINVLQSADFGDVFRQLIVTGSAELSIQNHLSFAFGEAYIDASANTGGLRLSLSSQHNAPQLDDITIFGSQTRDVITIDASAHGVLLNIDTNTGADTLILDSVHARAGSSITGATLTLRIEGSSSDLTGVSFGNVERIEIAGGSSLTLTQQQLTELGADTFAAGHAAGKVDLHIVVSQSTSLAELLDLDQLDSNVKLSFSVLKGATLSLTAEQLHLYLAHNNAVTGQGDLHITGAGLRFDPETGSAYGTGGRIDKDNIDGTVSITTEYNGFNRPAPGPDSNTLTITADGSGPLIISDDILAPHVSHLIIQGNQDVQLGGNIELGNNFTLNFAGLDGSIDSLTLS